MVTGCQPKSQAETFTDDAGREISIEKIPQRLVSHVPSITETLFALGLGEKVVGVSDYCDYPEEAKLKTSVGTYNNPSIENIVALEPDLVFTDGNDENLTSQLDSLGITYIVIEPEDIDGILKDIELLGKVTGTEKTAKKLINEMEESITHVLNRVKNAPQVRATYIFDTTDLNNPWTAGPGSFADFLITIAGGENIAAQALSGYVQFSIEEIVSADPEIIILPAKHGTVSTPPEALKKHPAWKRITAVNQDRIHVIDGDLVDRPGPRIVQGLEELAKIFHPELFR